MNKNICTKCEYAAERNKRRYTVSETVSVLDGTFWICLSVGQWGEDGALAMFMFLFSLKQFMCCVHFS